MCGAGGRSNTLPWSYTRCRKERDVKHRQEEYASNLKQTTFVEQSRRSHHPSWRQSAFQGSFPAFRCQQPQLTAKHMASENPSLLPKAEKTVPSSRQRSHESGFVWLLRYQCEYDRPEHLLPPADYGDTDIHYVSKRKLAASWEALHKYCYCRLRRSQPCQPQHASSTASLSLLFHPVKSALIFWDQSTSRLRRSPCRHLHCIPARRPESCGPLPRRAYVQH
jgi:hypothetical protein